MKAIYIKLKTRCTICGEFMYIWWREEYGNSWRYKCGCGVKELTEKAVFGAPARIVKENEVF